MKRDLFLAGILWLLLTAAGEALVLSVEIHPLPSSDKGEEIRHAFNVLMIMAVPVMMLVVSVLLYSVIMHRGGGGDTVPEAGETIYGRGPVPTAWLGVTAGLTLLVMIYPGLTSLKNVVENPTPDLVVNITGVQWTWLVGYPGENLENQRELVLPVDRTVRFNVKSLDVLHSFWVPAFAMKIDAVPGKTTGFTLKPNAVGSYDTDPLMRIQCAELCGLSHSRMTIPVRVLSQSEFELWLNEVRPTPSPAATPGLTPTPAATPSPASQTAGITANGNTLDRNQITPGPTAQLVTFEAPALGTYSLQSDADRAQMNGSLAVGSSIRSIGARPVLVEGAAR